MTWFQWHIVDFSFGLTGESAPLPWTLRTSLAVFYNSFISNHFAKLSCNKLFNQNYEIWVVIKKQQVYKMEQIIGPLVLAGKVL